ncbi:MAG: hypothetical protein RIT81_24730 [Deltaproteobacteria bacterium]
MDSTRAKQDAAAQRYRLQVRLSMVAKVALENGDAAASIEVTNLRQAVDAVRIEDEGGTQAALQALAALEPKVSALQERLGVGRYSAPVFPKWLRFLVWASPVVAVLLTATVWITLRRRKRAIDARSLEALDRAGSSTGT